MADGVFKRDGARVQNVGLDALAAAFRLLGSSTEKGGRLLWKCGWGVGGGGLGGGRIGTEVEEFVLTGVASC